MTIQEAKKLKVGDRVKWPRFGDKGTVTEKGEAGIRVTWDDKQVVVYLYHAGGIQHLERADASVP